MKIVTLTLILIATSVVLRAETNAPAYTNGQFYVWASTNGVTATNALDYINTSGWFPVTGNNAKTRKPEPDKQKTISWATNVQERVDGKRCFPRIPEKVLDAVGVPVAQRGLFFTVFKPDVETYQSDWFPVEEDE
jgi:hypothetical protein